MARTALNKSALHKQREQLKLYRRVLPSLELKRMQLAAEVARAREELARQEAERATHRDRVAAQLPMLANREVDASGLVRLESVRVGEQNVVGVRVPVLEGIDCTVAEYSLLAKPHWVDVVVSELQAVAELWARVQLARRRVEILTRAERRITQRVNLFEKILIPNAEQDIKRIRVFLGDAERDAVVRAKLSKALHQRQAEEAEA
jgi:V/A-type H+-transporting ATPase subunit D